MLVETFECQEVSKEQPEIESEAMGLIETLGLSGQKELLTPTESGEEKRMPYRQMTQREWFVVTSLCPERFKVDAYNVSPIPLRVLQVIAYCRAENYFDHLYIYDRASAEIKDPFLVGVCGSEYSSNKRFLLARWGEELDEWPALAKKALEVWKQRTREKISEVANEVSQMLPTLEAMGIDSACKKSSSPQLFWS